MNRLVHELKYVLKDDSIKWVDTSNIHLTLAFLGNTGIEYIDTISGAMRMASQGIEPFEIELKGLGVFKKISDPRVIFTGISTNEPLLQLRKDLVDKLTGMKLYNDERSFSPHITLCRVRSIKNSESLRKFIEGKDNYQVMKQLVDHFTLFESILKPSGPVYRELVRVPLNG